MFRTIVLSAVLAGLIGGAVATAAQSVRVTPLIREAEKYEAAARASSADQTAVVDDKEHDHNHDDNGTWAPEGQFQTLLATLGANSLAGIGFALLVTAAMSLHGEAGWYRGLLWSLGGFASFTLAPAAGLPPELPGMAAADLFSRQVWWLGTAASTAVGLAFIFLVRRLMWAALGAVLIVVPHLVGAPHASGPGVGLPSELIIEFGIASIVTNLLFWSALGIAAGIFFEKQSAAQ